MHQKKSGVVVALAALATIAASSASAQETLGYDDALSCSATYVVLAGAQEGDGDGESAAALQDIASRWLVMAMARDGQEGDRAGGEFDGATDEIIDTINAMSAADAETFLTDVIAFCDSMEVAYADEFGAIDLE